MPARFEIIYATGVEEDLRVIRAYDRSRILDTIEEQLRHTPTEETRNKKPIPGLVPPWDHLPPVWELRIGVFRVFYDVDENASTVTVRAVREKLAHQSTEQIL
jgi:mRNA-degrading endonuclease RelE of RelBE toxin-antitoxin system